MAINPKTILVTNDDGIYAPGLKLLQEAARAICDDVWVVAPQHEQSGASHSLTLHTPLRMAEYEPKKFAVEGTPTDCVLMAVKHVMPKKPDLVLSGINFGQNLADDVTYSGTVAAAMEGTALGIPSIALSQTMSYAEDFVPDWRCAEAHTLPVIKSLLNNGLGEGTLINVNFPNCAADEVKGIEITEQGARNEALLWIDARKDGRQQNYYWISFKREKSAPDMDTDLYAIFNNYISITPLHMNLTNVEAMAGLKKHFNS